MTAMATDRNSARSGDTSWTFPVGRAAGVAVRLNVAFVALLLGFCAIGFWTGHVRFVAYVIGAASGLLLHEVGHAVAARLLGYPVREVVLHPLRGSVVALADLRPTDLLFVALAGPVVNGTVALTAWAYLATAGVPTLAAAALRHVNGAEVVVPVLIANLVLGGVNLIPALPFDGGLMVRSLLSRRRDEAREIRVVSLSLACAVGFALFTLATGYLLGIVIAMLIVFGTSREIQMRRIQADLQDQPVSVAMVRLFATLSPDDSLGKAATDLVGAPSQRQFPVVLGSRAIGVVGRDTILDALAHRGGEVYVAEVMDRDVAPADIAEPLRRVLGRVGDVSQAFVLVTRDGTLVGMATAESIALYAVLRSVVREGGANRNA
jgi:Zn-dependent protease/CBS domain-containing protein